jgi:hypothetical protein
MNGGIDVVGATYPANTWYFAEGYTGPGFSEVISILNCADTPAWLNFQFQTQEGGIKEFPHYLEARKCENFFVNDYLGSGYSASLKLESDVPVVAQRSMFFDYGSGWAGGHAVMGATQLSNQYYFAEGTCRPGFDEYLTLQNPNDSQIAVNASYQLGDGGVISKGYSLPAQSRTTIFVPTEIGGQGNDAHYDVSVALTSASPFLAERPMYFNYNGFDGGHCVIGANSPGDDWFFAEGYTGGQFSEYLCIQNPGDTASNVDLSYYTQEQGPLAVKQLVIPAHSRNTIWVNNHAGPNLSLSARLKVTSGPAIVVERPMYFSYSGWNGGHDVVGLQP